MKKLSISILVAASCIAQGASINDLKHGKNASGQYELVFKGANVLPNVFTTNGPDTLVLDFSDTNSKIGKREISIATNGIYDVDIIDGGQNTRAVINLAAPLAYRVTQRGSDVVVSLDSGKQNNLLNSPRKINGSTNNGQGIFNILANKEAVKGSFTPVSNIRSSVARNNKAALSENPVLSSTFTKKNGNAGVVTFGLPKAGSANVSVRQVGNKIVASIDGYYATASEQKRMEVDSYGTAVGSVDIFRTARGTDIVLNIKRNQPIEFSSFQNGDTYSIEVKKPSNVSATMKQKQIDELQGFGSGKSYHGSPLSLNFQDIEVRAVLQIIAEFTNNNIVVSDAVSGNITLRLDNVPWDQALDIILKTKGLGMRKNGSVIYVAPASELDQREIDAYEYVQKLDQLVPSRTELIQVKYSNASDLAAILEKSREGIRGDGVGKYFQDSILSSKGTVSVDTRTNTLLVSDIPSKLQSVRELVAKLDEPVRQVLVDARLVLTSDEFSRSLGSRFGISFFNSGNSNIVTGSGKASGASGWDVDAKAPGLAQSVVQNLSSGSDNPIGLPNISDRLGVNMPVSGGSSYGLAILGADFLVDLELSALQTEGKAEIVSSPRVVTQDGKKARIASGQQIPYRVATKDGITVAYKNAELSMDVTPRIAPDNRVDLFLDIKKDSADYARRIEDGVPINTNQLDTNVLVDNGETIVLGGIYEHTQSLSTDKVPLLGDLPVIGSAFKKTNKDFKKNELLIFVTPRIIDNRLSDYDKFSNLRN